MPSEPTFQLSLRPGAVDFDGCRSLVREKRFTEARDALTQLLSREPDNPQALELMVRVAVSLGKSGAGEEEAWRDTIPYLERLVELDPRRVDTQLVLARYYRRMRDYDKALGALQAVNELDPGNLDVADKLANMHVRRGDYEKARPIVETALRHNPDSEKLWALKARLEAQVGATDQLEATLRRIVSMNPRRISQRIQLIRLLTDQQRLDEARQALNGLPQKSSLRPMRYLLGGDIMFHDGRFEDAIVDFRAALLNTPSGRDIIAGLEGKNAQPGEGPDSGEEGAGGERPANLSERADAFRRAARKALRSSMRERRSERSGGDDAAPTRGGQDLDELDETLDALLGPDAP
jgi:tetratricopeptide (TPR) repeat protein